MANPEHVEILKQGVEAWNRWRENNPDIKPDLNGSFFCGHFNEPANFDYTDISKADFRRAFLRGSSFYGPIYLRPNSMVHILNMPISPEQTFQVLISIRQNSAGRIFCGQTFAMQNFIWQISVVPPSLFPILLIQSWKK